MKVSVRATAVDQIAKIADADTWQFMLRMEIGGVLYRLLCSNLMEFI